MDVRNRGVHPSGAPKTTASTSVNRPAVAATPQSSTVKSE